MANKQIFNFSGGMNVQTSPLVIKENECELAVNYVLDRVGALQRRGGYDTRFLAEANKPINGMFAFYDASASTWRTVAVVNNSGDTNGVIKYLSGVWTDGKTNDTASKRTYFAAFVDNIFRTNGADVVAASTTGQTWVTSATPSTLVPATITPKFCKVFQDRLYLANDTQAAGKSSRVYFSSLPSAGAITWDTTNDYLDVNPDDGDVITGLENNGNRLLIFKSRAMYRWQFGQVEADRIIGVGTDSQDSIATNFDVGITFFANRNGVYAYSGGRPRLISRKIQPYINAVSNWTTVYGICDKDHYYLAVGDITVNKQVGYDSSQNQVAVGGRTFTNVVLCYHIALDAWTIFSLAHKPTVFASVGGFASGDPLRTQIGFGATDGATYMTTTFDNATLESNNLPVVADFTTGISSEFISKEIMLSYPQRTNMRWLDVFSQTPSNTFVWYDLDRNNNFVQLDGVLIDRTTNFRIPTAECNSVRIKFADNPTRYNVMPPLIEGLTIEHYPKDKRDEMLVKVRTRSTGYNNG